MSPEEADFLLGEMGIPVSFYNLSFFFFLFLIITYFKLIFNRHGMVK